MLIFKFQIVLTVIVSSHIYYSGNRNRTLAPNGTIMISYPSEHMILGSSVLTRYKEAVRDPKMIPIISNLLLLIRMIL
jgi:hypothetical protein